MLWIHIINLTIILFVVGLFIYKKFNWVMIFYALILGMCVFTLTYTLDQKRSAGLKKSVAEQMQTDLGDLRSRLEMTLYGDLALIHGLSAFISINPNMTKEMFNEFSESLMQYNSHLLNFGAAPNLVLEYIYPLKGNEVALGLKFEELPDQKNSALQATKSRKITVAGPIKLVQGHEALVGRVATFTKDKQGKEHFWGLVSAPISIEDLFADVGVSEFQNKYQLAIRGKDGLGAKGDVFYGSSQLFTKGILQLEVSLPSGTWVLAAAPKLPWSYYDQPHYGFWGVAWLFYGLMCVLLFTYAQTIILRQKGSELLHKSEELFRIMFENSPVGITLIDANLFHVNVNKAYMQIHGYTKEELSLQKITDFSNGEINKEELIELEKLKTQTQIGPYLKTIKRKDGSLRYLNIVGFQMITKNEQKVLWVFADDITKEKLFEDKIIAEREIAVKSKIEAEISAKSKSTFLATMSHEIRTPINGIMSSADLLNREKLSQDQREYVEIIIRSSNFLLNIINDILDLAKYEEGKVQIEVIPVNLAKLVDNLYKIFLLVGQEKSLDFKLEIDDLFKQKYVISDPTRINQLLTNLCSNAFKFTEKGFVSISIKVVGEKIEMKVEDSGIGLHEKFMEKIFSPFTQVDETISRRYGGTGLGLSICKSICRLLNGDIKVKSEVGKGSAFLVELPLIWGDEIKGSDNQFKVIDRRYSKKILFVDDNPINLKLGVKILEKLGVEVFTAVNGIDAIEKVSLNPDLILMDIQMPMMDGIQAYQEIRKIGFHRPILALTANVMLEDVAHYKKIGFDEVLSKPFKLEDLVKVLDLYFV